MLTRIEIDGFKTFENFTLDLAPFTVILGNNAAGKSNLFDAIQLLSRLAATDLREAVKGIRGEVDELFRFAAPGRQSREIHFAVEVLLDPVVRDPWGNEVELIHTRIRYDLTIRRQQDERGIERLFVSREEARPIPRTEDSWPKRNRVSGVFRKHHLRYFSRRSKYLSTDTGKDDRGNDRAFFSLHQDGVQGKRSPTLPAHEAQATVLSSITTSDRFKHLFALRQEMLSWRMLQLDPAALRRPSPVVAPELLESDGANLATVLARIKAETAEPAQPRGRVGDIAEELANLIPGVMDLDVLEDRNAREYRIELKTRDGVTLPSRVISDGTLRVLSLLTVLNDPQHRGVLCFEEPENGIHPTRLRSFIDCLADLITDPARFEEADTESPEALSQLLLNSHSPVVLAALRQQIRQGDGAALVVFADVITAVDPENRTTSRKTRMRPVMLEAGQDSMLPDKNTRGEVVSDYEVQGYLNTVVDPAEWA